MYSGFYQDAGSTAKPGDLLDTQASYGLPLAQGAYAPANQALALTDLLATITRENKLDAGGTAPSYSLRTGFIGTAWIAPALADHGHVAYRLLQQTSYPSWLYPVQQGATTAWERLNSYTRIESFGSNNHRDSLNHYSFGAVASWLCDTSLGVARDEQSPGFRHFAVRPTPDTHRPDEFCPQLLRLHARPHRKRLGPGRPRLRVPPRSARQHHRYPLPTHHQRAQRDRERPTRHGDKLAAGSYVFTTQLQGVRARASSQPLRGWPPFRKAEEPSAGRRAVVKKLRLPRCRP